MTRASWITLLATVVLSSFAGAAQNSGKAWWLCWMLVKS
jgi:hypothetical protein